MWGPPGGLLQGNNELAVGLVTLVPFLYWMRQTSASRWAKVALTASIALCAMSILGTQSRGALLAIGAMALFLGLKSNKPLQTTLMLGLLLAIAIAFMPSSWTERMDTIANYKDDGSAMSRLWTWQTLWNAAVDRPFVGAGFRADARIVFSMYAPKGGEWAVFEGAILVAHSIYFQMLGEHGFVGLGLFLMLWASVWIAASRVERRAQSMPDLAAWLPMLMRMTQVSLVGYLVGGAFLSLAYLDLAYFFMGFVIVADRLVRDAASKVPAAVRPQRLSSDRGPLQKPTEPA